MFFLVSAKAVVLFFSQPFCPNRFISVYVNYILEAKMLTVCNKGEDMLFPSIDAPVPVQ